MWWPRSDLICISSMQHTFKYDLFKRSKIVISKFSNLGDKMPYVVCTRVPARGQLGRWHVVILKNFQACSRGVRVRWLGKYVRRVQQRAGQFPDVAPSRDVTISHAWRHYAWFVPLCVSLCCHSRWLFPWTLVLERTSKKLHNLDRWTNTRNTTLDSSELVCVWVMKIEKYVKLAASFWTVRTLSFNHVIWTKNKSMCNVYMHKLSNFCILV